MGVRVKGESSGSLPTPPNGKAILYYDDLADEFKKLNSSGVSSSLGGTSAPSAPSDAVDDQLIVTQGTGFVTSSLKVFHQDSTLGAGANWVHVSESNPGRNGLLFEGENLAMSSSGLFLSYFANGFHAQCGHPNNQNSPPSSGEMALTFFPGTAGEFNGFSINRYDSLITGARAVGDDVFFYVSGTVGRGSTTDAVAVFDGSTVVSGDLVVEGATPYADSHNNSTVQTTNATLTSVSSYNVANLNRAIDMKVRVFASSSTNGETAKYVIESLFMASSVNLEEKDTNFVSIFEENAAWDVQLGITSSAIHVMVQGSASQTVEWRVMYEINEHGV